MEMIGGQAVIEGVMIRNKNKLATAVRTKKGIIVKKEDIHSLTEKHKLLRIPIVRGAIGLGETMVLGIKTLNWSADLAMQDQEEQPTSNSWGLTASLIAAIIFAIAIFIFLPLWITTTFFGIEKTTATFNLVAGIIRIILFLAYIYAISFWKDVKTLFQYHGAEHKSVNCYENEKKVNIKNTLKYSTIHNRCGTSFLLVMLIIAIIGFSVIDTLVAWALGGTSLWIRLGTHILFLPLILGVSYEIIRKAQTPNLFVKILIFPGLLLQRITTQEPTEAQIEVAIKALEAVTD